MNGEIYEYAVTAKDTAGNKSLLSDEISVQTGVFLNTPSTDLSVDGTVTGNLLDVEVSDDSRQTITEIERDSTSILEHEWTFNLAGEELTIFYVEAHHTKNNEGDNFVFAYSTNGSDYIEMVTITKTVDDDTAQYYVLPPYLSGPVRIRVHDTDGISGNNKLDKLYIDKLVIESE